MRKRHAGECGCGECVALRFEETGVEGGGLSRHDALVQVSYANKIYAAPVEGVMRSGIQITTASAICAVLDMLASGDLPQAGFVRQEQIPLAAFLANRFGRNYAASDPGLLPGVRVA